MRVARVTGSGLGLHFCNLPVMGQRSGVLVNIVRVMNKIDCRPLQPVAAARHGHPNLFPQSKPAGHRLNGDQTRVKGVVHVGGQWFQTKRPR